MIGSTTRESKLLRWDSTRRVKITLSVIATGSLLIALWALSRSGAALKGPPPPPALPVAVQSVSPQTVPLAPKFLAQTEASQTVEIRARVNGYLLERAFKEGQHVEKGQLLFRIDPAPFETELAMARAQLAGAEARLARAESQVKRFAALLAKGSATTGEAEEWQKEYGTAKADVDLANARIAQAELDLGYTTISSPVAGFIGRAAKDVGSYIQQGAESLLATVQQIDPIYARYSVSEQELLEWQRRRASGEIRVPSIEHLDLEITLSDGRAYPHRGRVNYLDVQVDPSTGTSVVRGVFPNPDRTLLPGQFVHVTVHGIERVDVITVPQKAVQQNPTGSYVYVVTEQNKLENRPVTLGEWVNDRWIVEKGLAPGERVVVNKLTSLRPGMEVVPSGTKGPEEEAPSAAGGA